MTFSVPCHYPKQYKRIVNWIFGNEIQSIFYQKAEVVIYDNAPDIDVSEMAAILSRGRWVKPQMD